MTDGGEADAALQRLAGLDDGDIDLAGAALALAARERPGVAPGRYLAHLEEMARDVADEAEAIAGIDRPGAEEQLAALAMVIHGRHGYEGDRQTYDDLQNANLMRVIDRRRGLPIALGILYIHCGRRLGWSVDGLNFPGHFLLRIEAGADRVIADPFDGGRRIEAAGLRTLLKATLGPDAELAPGHYAPAGNREILIRLENNRKIRLLKAEQVGEALRSVEAMLLFAPGEAALWHEAGVLNAHTGNLHAALVALGHAHDLADTPEARMRADRLIAEIRGRLN